MSATSKLAQRMEETAELLDRGVNVALVVAGIVAAIAYVVLLFAAFSSDVSRNGGDSNFGDGSGRGGDIIVLPAQPF